MDGVTGSNTEQLRNAIQKIQGSDLVQMNAISYFTNIADVCQSFLKEYKTDKEIQISIVTTNIPFTISGKV